jgi:hypothetical protein
MLFLIIVGAVWDATDWRGWVLVPLFVAGRVLGKWTGIVASKTAVGAYLPKSFADRRNWVTPLSGFSVALVISVQSLYMDAGLTWIVTAVIGGSFVTELLVSRSGGGTMVAADGATSMPLDELEREPLDELDDLDEERDAPDGPIYRDEPLAPPKPPSTGEP